MGGLNHTTEVVGFAAKLKVSCNLCQILLLPVQPFLQTAHHSVAEALVKVVIQ